MKLSVVIAISLIIILMAGTSMAGDVSGCLDKMGDIVETKVAGNMIFVKLTKQVPLNKYEDYYYHAMSLLCMCETSSKKDCLEGVKEIVFTNMYGKLGRVFEVASGGREACHDVSSAPPSRGDIMSIAMYTHMQ